jgi:hypothetical protein
VRVLKQEINSPTGFDNAEKHYLIIGAGNIGFRHFQGILKSRLNFRLSVVDPDPSKFERFQCEVENLGKKNLNIMFFRNLDFSSEYISVAIIATNSNVRPSVMEHLNRSHKVQSTILEKLITNSIKDIDAMEELGFNQDTVSVNYPRRIMNFYREIADNLIINTNLNFKVEGKKWNLISNTPHFIDLVEFLTGSELVKVSHIELCGDIYETRPGFIDTTGKIVCDFSDNSKLELVSSAEDPVSNSGLVVWIKSTELTAEINEFEGRATGELLRKDIYGKIQHQSDLSGEIVETIDFRGESNLTTYKAAARSHRVYLAALEYFNRVKQIKDLDYNKIT